MKGFTRNKKFVPMTDYKKVTRKSRDQNEKSKGVVIRKARTITIPKLHRAVEQERGRVKFWAESTDGNTIVSLVDGSFPEEMEVRISTDEDNFSVVGHRSIMDEWSFDEFKNFADKHLERHKDFTRNKSEPFPVGKRRPEGLGDEDVIEALQGKKELTRADLIGMQRQPRKARVPPDATKKELIKMLDGRFTELTGGDFVPATNFDFKNFKKEQVGQILEGSIEIPQTYYAIRDQKSGLIELRQKRFKPQFKRGREHPHDLIATARDLPELESMIKTIEASP